MVPCGVARNFERGGDIISTFFFSFFFGQNKFEADQEARKALGGSWGLLPRKSFENLQAVMAILVRFE